MNLFRKLHALEMKVSISRLYRALLEIRLCMLVHELLCSVSSLVQHLLGVSTTLVTKAELYPCRQDVQG